MRPTNAQNRQTNFENGLQTWIDSAPENERPNRELARNRMLEYYRTNSGFSIFNFSRRSRDNLDLSGLGLTSIPAEIGNLTKLKSLDLHNNQLENLPDTIGNLTKLKRLNLCFNQLTEVPNSINNLEKLQELYLNDNRFTELPDAIGNLAQLINLDLSRNQLNTIPESFFRRRNQRLELNLENNLITANEAPRLGALAQNNNITLLLSLFDAEPAPFYFNNATQEQGNLLGNRENIVAQMSEAFPQERREDLRSFLQQEELTTFRSFLEECSRTEGWKNSKEQMLNTLINLVEEMEQKPNLKDKCLAIAETALGSCGDRVALAYTQMLVTQNSEQMPVTEMSLEQLAEVARKEAVVNFLNEKAEAKLEQIKAIAGFIDEIETYLAYLQAAPRLGLNLPANGMLYRGCSNVSDDDLENAVAEFNAFNIGARIANHIYENDELRKHPAINKIITEVGNRPEFETDYLTNKNGEVIETDAQYQKRVGNLGSDLKRVILSEVSDLLEQHLRATNNSTNAPAAAYEEGFEPGGRFHTAQESSSSAAVNLEQQPAVTAAVPETTETVSSQNPTTSPNHPLEEKTHKIDFKKLP